MNSFFPFQIINPISVILRFLLCFSSKSEVVYNLHDEYCPETHTSSMARTTGYTATAAANMFLEGLFKEKGVFPPELVGKHKECFDYILKYLEDRNIHYVKSTQLI